MTLDSILALATGATAITLLLVNERRNERFRQLAVQCFAMQGRALIENLARVAALESHLGVEITFEGDSDDGGDEAEDDTGSSTSSAALLETGE